MQKLIIAREKIDCGFERLDGFLISAVEGTTSEIDDEEKALLELGIHYQRQESCPAPQLLPGPCLKLTGQGQLHPVKYLQGLAAAVHKLGSTVQTGTRVVRIESGSPCRVHTESGETISASSIVLATNVPFDAGVTLHAKLAAYTTYAVALEIPRQSVPNALYWDTAKPFHYIRVYSPPEHETDLLIVGGEDHKTGQASDQADRWAQLVSWARGRLMQAGELRHQWSGQVFQTPDGLGLNGRAPWGDHLYVITGDSRSGLTNGTLGAQLVSNLIRGDADPLANVYSPSRWMPGALLTMLGENFNLATQFGEWLTGGDVGSFDSIPPGQGAIVRSGLSKIAAYRDDSGKLTTLSAACPHMGGVVQWNPGEKTWDCPCHGSRFRCTGEVLHGPTVKPLAVVQG